MKISVLIVTYNSDAHIKNCVDSIFNQPEPVEVIVVDNASSDQTRQILKLDGRIRFIENRDNVGFSEAVNQASDYATGEYVLLLNPDTILSRSALSHLKYTLESSEDIAATGPISNYAGGLQSIKHWYENPRESMDPAQTEHVAQWLKSKFKKASHRTKLLTGFCLLMRTAEFRSIGRLDSELRLGFDDLDLCWRLSLQGKSVALVLGAYVYHAWHQSFEKGDPQMVDSMHQKSHEYFSLKLKRYYGSFAAIPASTELWGVDWFTPVDMSEPLENQHALPQQLIRHLNGSSSIGVLAQGQCLDLNNNPIAPENCESLVWRLSPLELPGAALYLRSLRTNKLKYLLVLFDNCWYQNPTGTPWNHVGLSPYDVRREVLQAGFRIDSMEAWESSPQTQFNSQYGDAHIRSKGFLPNEILMAQSSRILIKAQTCNEAHHLQYKVSIVLLALNQVEYTKKCIDSLQKYCTQPFELILVNNGSTDGTRAYFDSIAGAKVIHNEQNRGVAAGWNQGMALATGDYVLILNNDTIAGPDFLENLVRCACNHQNVGMVVPRSNRIAGPQMVDGFEYGRESEIPKLSRKIQIQNALSAWEFPRLKGFCMLIPKHVIQEIGFFDEDFGFGNFEDDDYSCRIRYAGYQLLVADDSFLFHYGSVSFKDSGVDWNAQMVKNMAIFNKKWSNGRPIRQPLQNQDLSDLQIGIRLESQEQYTEAFTVYRKCLEDPLVAEEAGTRITTMLSIHYTASSSAEVLKVLREKFPHIRSLFPQTTSQNLEQWRQEVQSLLEASSLSDAYALVEARRSLDGDSFDVCNFTGLIKFYHGIFDEACQWFERALKIIPSHEDALLNFHDACLRMGNTQKSMAYLEHALTLVPDSSTARMAYQELKSVANHHSADYSRIIYFRECNIAVEHMIREGITDKAKGVLEELLAEQPENYRALNNMGLLEWYAGRADAAFILFARSIRSNPWYIDALGNLYDCALLTGRQEEVIPLLQLVQSANPGHSEVMKIQNELDTGTIPDRLQVYFRKDQEQVQLEDQIRMGHALLQEQKIDSAIILFTDLLKKYPNHIECLNGIGIGAFYRGNYEDAMILFKHAVELAPLDEDSLENYWDAAIKLGRTEQVLPLLKNAVAIDPSLNRIATILEGIS